MSFSLSSNGSFSETEAWLRKLRDGTIFDTLSRFGQEGVNALASATPVESGVTAGAWSFEVKKDATSYSIIWSNSHVVGGTPVAILLQYGHGTGTGGYVQGRDYINPALRPIFDRIEAEVERAVRS